MEDLGTADAKEHKVQVLLEWNFYYSHFHFDSKQKYNAEVE